MHNILFIFTSRAPDVPDLPCRNQIRSGGGGTNREFVVEDKLSLNTSKVKIEEEPAINEP